MPFPLKVFSCYINIPIVFAKIDRESLKILAIHSLKILQPVLLNVTVNVIKIVTENSDMSASRTQL